ncbi:MAG: carbonic anhydrase [Rhodopila sp.]
MSKVPCGCSAYSRLLDGVRRFRAQVYPKRQELFDSLANGQSPHTLFITCADSRISPEMITQSDPGELFVCRNIGNVVPAYGEMLGGVSAVVEYACEGLGVSDIVICGHSDCGAMKALLTPDADILRRMPTVSSWLRNAEAARSVVEMTQSDLDAPGKLSALVEQNVRVQLANLRTHPSVAARLAAGTLALHGWVFGIDRGTISVFDEREQRLLPIEPVKVGAAVPPTLPTRST